jgi:hypothetical protein
MTLKNPSLLPPPLPNHRLAVSLGCGCPPLLNTSPRASSLMQSNGLRGPLFLAAVSRVQFCDARGTPSTRVWR